MSSLVGNFERIFFMSRLTTAFLFRTGEQTYRGLYSWCRENRNAVHTGWERQQKV